MAWNRGIGLAGGLFWLALPHAPTQAATPQAPPGKPYVFGFAVAGGSGDKAQINQLFNTLTQVFTKSTGIPMQSRPYRDGTAFWQAVKKREVAFTLNAPLRMLKEGYHPFLAFGLFGVDNPTECLVVKKDSPYKTPRALAGKKVAMLTGSGRRYLRFRKFLGAPPESLFTYMAPMKNDASLVYAVAMGQADATWVNLWSFKFLERTNPGPTRKTRLLACTTLCPEWVSVDPRVPAPVREKVKHFLATLNTNPLTKPYAPLLKFSSLRFRPFKPADAQACRRDVADYERMERLGWERDYSRWEAYSSNLNQ